MLYGTITEFCTETSCSVMSAGPRYARHFRLLVFFPLSSRSKAGGSRKKDAELTLGVTEKYEMMLPVDVFDMKSEGQGTCEQIPGLGKGP